LQHICKPHKDNAQTQACKRAAILPTHPSPPTTQKHFDENSAKNFGNRNLMTKFAKNWQLNILIECKQ